MMLTVTTAAATWFALGIAVAAAPSAAKNDTPPIIVTLMPGADLPPQLVTAVLIEAAAIWRPAGVSFVWRHAPRTSSAPNEPGPFAPNPLRLTIGDRRGTGKEGRLPLGWIVFDDVAAPEPEIYVSLANATSLMNLAPGVVG